MLLFGNISRLCNTSLNVHAVIESKIDDTVGNVYEDLQYDLDEFPWYHIKVC
jgi:hypothetical protein